MTSRTGDKLIEFNHRIYSVGVDYKYIGDGDPCGFFRDTRPLERKRPLEPTLVEVPPEKGNPYGIELLDE